MFLEINYIMFSKYFVYLSSFFVKSMIIPSLLIFLISIHFFEKQTIQDRRRSNYLILSLSFCICSMILTCLKLVLSCMILITLSKESVFQKGDIKLWAENQIAKICDTLF